MSNENLGVIFYFWRGEGVIPAKTSLLVTVSTAEINRFIVGSGFESLLCFLLAV